MFYRFFFFLLGLLVASLALSAIIISFSLLSFGYSLADFNNMLFRQPQLYLFIGGIIMMALTLFVKRSSQKRF